MFTAEQCEQVYRDLITSYLSLREQTPSSDQPQLRDRCVGMLCALRLVRGDKIDLDLLPDIAEADIRAVERGSDAALNVRWE